MFFLAAARIFNRKLFFSCTFAGKWMIIEMILFDSTFSSKIVFFGTMYRPTEVDNNRKNFIMVHPVHKIIFLLVTGNPSKLNPRDTSSHWSAGPHLSRWDHFQIKETLQFHLDYYNGFRNKLLRAETSPGAEPPIIK